VQAAYYGHFVTRAFW